MKKTVIIIFTVAILGALGAYAKSHDSKSPTLGSKNSSAQAAPLANSSALPQTAKYKDGTFSGDSAETPYGAVQIAAIITGGKITGIDFLKMPNDDERSRQITKDSKDALAQAAIAAQNANIDFISGATSTSYGYQESLQAALDKAVIR